MRYILAIDQGTTGSRAIVYDRSGRCAASAYEEFPQHFPQPGWVEHDPRQIWRSVHRCIDRVLQSVPARSIAAVGITNQRETTVVWDRVTGTPVYNAIVWQCRRTAGRCDQLRRDPVVRKLVPGRTGLPLDAYFSATKIEWILKHVPGAAARARQGRLCFGTTDSWVLWNLTAGAVHATDFTNASRSMLFDINKQRWDGDLLKIFSVPGQMLPEVWRSSGLFGRTAACGRLPAGVPICGIAGDQQAALFGQACFRPGSMKNTYGTGAFLLQNTGAQAVRSSSGLITTMACAADGGPCYALEGSIFIAGAAIQWLRDQLGLLKSSGQSESMARSLTDNQGVYFVPALVGLGAPYWNAHCRGAVFGITRGTRPAHLVRAALEAMCYQTKDVLEAMEKDSGLKVKSLKVDGGAAANDFLCQFQADMLGIEIVRPTAVETTSLGAAYLAGLAVGYWQDTRQISRCWKQDRVFRPRMSRQEAARYYAGWRSAVMRTLHERS